MTKKKVQKNWKNGAEGEDDCNNKMSWHPEKESELRRATHRSTNKCACLTSCPRTWRASAVSRWEIIKYRGRREKWREIWETQRKKQDKRWRWWQAMNMQKQDGKKYWGQQTMVANFKSTWWQGNKVKATEGVKIVWRRWQEIGEYNPMMQSTHCLFLQVSLMAIYTLNHRRPFFPPFFLLWKKLNMMASIFFSLPGFFYVLICISYWGSRHLAILLYSKVVSVSTCGCNTLQHTATHCNTLQRTAKRCNTQ